MKTNLLRNIIAFSFLSISLTSCFEYEDEGPLQYQEENYAITEFERLEIGDAMVINVTQGNYFSVEVRGDRRNIDDLEVFKSGNTLVVRYDDYESRKHDTYVDVVMPAVSAAVFSGASKSVITGFDDMDMMNISLSGASVSQIDVETSQLSINLSGASVADLRGQADNLQGEISGASSLKALTMPMLSATLRVSGASLAKVNVSDNLDANVSGASIVIYRGNPVITKEVSGGSSVQHE